MGLAYDKAYIFGPQLDSIPGYINAYIVTLGYGGPEEGGWWFDEKTPLASIRVKTEEEARQAFNLLEDLYREDWADEPQRSSVVSNGDLQIIIEDSRAQSQPQDRPHYC